MFVIVFEISFSWQDYVWRLFLDMISLTLKQTVMILLLSIFLHICPNLIYTIFTIINLFICILLTINDHQFQKNIFLDAMIYFWKNEYHHLEIYFNFEEYPSLSDSFSIKKINLCHLWLNEYVFEIKIELTRKKI